MFTGIVEETGEVLATTETDDGLRLRIGTDLGDLSRGASIAISGACLTVEDFGPDPDDGASGYDRWFEVFLAAETLSRTYLGDLSVGEAVNVERAMPADGRFDGHVVQGHVDATAAVTAVESVGEDWLFEFSLPEDLAPYLVEKGSITVDGISLTVADLSADAFRVAIIPETYRVTTLSGKGVGDPVHLEVDVIAKYVERLVGEYRAKTE